MAPLYQTIKAMKTLCVKIASVLFCLITISSCSEENSHERNLTVSETMLNFEAQANSSTAFEIRSNTKWTLATPSVEWLELSLTSMDNNGIVTLKADENTDLDIRTAEIVVSAIGIKPITVSVVQKCTPHRAIDYKAFGGPLPKKDNAILFAAGLISTPTAGERVVAITPDGSELFFTRIAEQGPRIYRSGYRNKKWQTAEVANFSPNDIATEPFISPDGKKLFFISVRQEYPTPDIWVSQRVNNAWSEPTRLNENVNTPDQEWHPSVSANGDLYFASTKAGGSGNADLYFSKFENGNYAMNQNLGTEINTAHNEWDPYVSPDGKYMIFKSDRPGGLGGMDMYITLKKNGKWTTPRNLGAPINTTIDDDAGDVTPDGKYLIFARMSPGAMNVYWIAMDALKSFIKN